MRLGKDPATTLHHIRKLVAAGFLTAQRARRGARGAREIPYRATMASRHIGVGTDGTPAERLAELSAREAILAAYLGEVADLGLTEVDQVRLALSLRRQDREEFHTRLTALVEEFRERDPDGDRLGVYVALYPSG
ncbi:hypothetical protein EV191_102391 [Tamaricihabitans halophyticus]|uniref:ArsR family transcriptional regulator n=1 Tax=Tamaricihabitans halophyticus TaxID=1262583 RepID=A0A4R2R0S9_9PSEU|nr:hypothetical protein EV191_102391 [Tamaricihabitans halophyticus]